MDLPDIIATICDEADDFLADVTKRDEAKAGIAEWLTMHHPQLTPAERKLVISEVMEVLDDEGFFERAAGGDE